MFLSEHRTLPERVLISGRFRRKEFLRNFEPRNVVKRDCKLITFEVILRITESLQVESCPLRVSSSRTPLPKIALALCCSPFGLVVAGKQEVVK
jgi:hypothetical protein